MKTSTRTKPGALLEDAAVDVGGGLRRKAMYTVTVFEGAFLTLAVLTTVSLLVAGVVALFPRASATLAAGVYCPVLRRPARAQLTRDEWTRRFVDVTSCSVLGTPGTVFCRKACLSTPPPSPRVTRA